MSKLTYAIVDIALPTRAGNVLPGPQVAGLTKFNGAKNCTLQDYGLSQGGGPYGLDGED